MVLGWVGLVWVGLGVGVLFLKMVQFSEEEKMADGWVWGKESKYIVKNIKKRSATNLVLGRSLLVRNVPGPNFFKPKSTHISGFGELVLYHTSLPEKEKNSYIHLFKYHILYLLELMFFTINWRGD